MGLWASVIAAIVRWLSAKYLGVPAWLLCSIVVAVLIAYRRAYLRARCVSAAKAKATSRKLSTPMHFMFLCAGTRGDVQPFLSVARGLVSRGHTVTMCTCDQFKSFVETHGISFASAGMDHVEQGPEWLTATSMGGFLEASAKQCESSMMSVGTAAWKVCKGENPAGKPVDVILANLFMMNHGMDLAEALSIPCWLLKLCPDEPTRDVPPFGEAPSRFGWLNLLRHYLRLGVMVRAAGRTRFTELQNKFRREVCGIGDVGLARLTEMSHTPTLLGYSPTLLPAPSDWGPWLMPCGFWFLDAPSGYTPPAHLAEFMSPPAGSKPVCVTFGSMAVVDTTNVVANAVQAVLQAGHRCVLIAGWAQVPEGVPADTQRVCMVKEVPHEWLFPRCAAVVYHGGAGTLARVASSGVPSVVVPILKFFDQPGWAETVAGQGIGAHVKAKPTVDAIGAALASVLAEDGSGGGAPARAQAMGAELRKEDGVTEALDRLETCLCARFKLAPHMFTPAAQTMCARHCIACRAAKVK